MPIYEYHCAECGAHFELIRKFSDPPLEKCTKCGGKEPEKLVSASAFHLKGSGWYATDYGTGGKGDDEAGTGNDVSGAKGDAESDSVSSKNDTDSSKASGSESSKNSTADVDS